ncbi:hypothetical protein llg_30170 [Luteolibacter sp. LG18]|nr:hypothetical protein llg_30170 [Luteolibacter sp. LG18]
MLRVVLCATAVASASPLSATTVDGITFDGAPEVYLPVNETARRLGWNVARDKKANLSLNGVALTPKTGRRSFYGAELVSIAKLAEAGATLFPGENPGEIEVYSWTRHFTVTVSPKRVEVSLKRQRLRAWQGDRLVLQTKISSGRSGRSTPAGEFKAGPSKERLHRSRLYNNAPMPWAVQINGHVFIHGFTSVPDYPASHGCIRMPLGGKNAARCFYEWVVRGTPVSVARG